METFSPAIGEFSTQRPVTRSFDVFYQSLNKRFSKQSRPQWFETPSPSSWRHCIENRTASESITPDQPVAISFTFVGESLITFMTGKGTRTKVFTILYYSRTTFVAFMWHKYFNGFLGSSLYKPKINIQKYANHAWPGCGTCIKPSCSVSWKITE